VTTSEEATNNDKINFFSLNKKIAELDALLEGMKERVSDFKNDMQVYDYIVAAQDSLFRLTQAMRSCEIIEFAEPWIEPADLLLDGEKKEDHEY
jgi:hypothetical protein